MENMFMYKGQLYEKGAIIEIKENKIEDFNFCSILVFDCYDVENNCCVFHHVGDCWKVFNIHILDLENVIKEVTPAYSSTKNKSSHKVEEKYIEGIVSAWIWYILIMIFALLAKDPGSKILTWIVASVVFFSWRRKKLNGK